MSDWDVGSPDTDVARSDLGARVPLPPSGGFSRREAVT